ncbi:MAG: thioredoxin family protein [Planctomycetota bacterium]|jgi:small redox-active disulfide protein 2
MKIQILGTGCAKCDKLYKHTQQAIDGRGIDAELEKVTDLGQIMAFGVMTTPALVIDGQVKVTGKVPSADDIQKMIQ